MARSESILQFSLAFDNKYLFNGKREDGIYLYASLLAGASDETARRTPLNIALVIDRSGSMADRNKLDYVKEACKLVIDNLSSSDYVSVVAYSTEVEVIRKSSLLRDKLALKRMIDAITPTNATNLSGGMLEGYAQVNSQFDPRRINRVLLLSDGLANTGICDADSLQRIVKEQYHNNKIAISAFGVGADFNEDLMASIAEYGKGNYYFIDSPDKIPRIFKQELQGLLSVVAQNVRINIKPADGFRLEKVFAYNYKMDGDELSVDFNDVFAEEEKVLLVKYSVEGELKHEAEFLACLLYDDVGQNYMRIHECMGIHIAPTADKEIYRAGENAEAIKNKVLLVANEQFEEAVKAVDQHDYEKARDILKENKAFMGNYSELVNGSAELEAQMESGMLYEAGLDSIANQSAEDFSMTQKMTKSRNYLLRKKRSQHKA